MPYNIWLFPLISGFYIVNNYIYFKYKFQRVSAQRLIIHSIIIGVLSFSGIYIVRRIANICCPNVLDFLYNFIYGSISTSRQPLLITSFLGFLLVIISVETLNFILKKQDYFNRKKPVEVAVEKYGDELEKLFLQSFLKKLLIQVTLKNNKVYIGYASEILPPQKTNFLKIIPILSGYRVLDTKEVRYTTDYSEAIEMYENSPNQFADIAMDVIIKQDEILVASIFDIEIYEAINPSISFD